MEPISTKSPKLHTTNARIDNLQEPGNIMVLDGGFGTQLRLHVSKSIDGDVLWSARYLATDQDAVVRTHLDFLRAGADIISTDTYQANIDLFMKHLEISEEDSFKLIKNAVTLARTAISNYQDEFPNSRQPLIAGSVGPYGAALHDGSEYTGSYAKNTPIEKIRKWHIPRIKALVEGGVDVLAFETIPCKIEAEMLVQLLKDEFPDAKAWLTFSCSQDGKTLAFGENFQETAKYCYDLNPSQIIAVGLNCLTPRLVESFIGELNKDRMANPIPIIIYPNNGESYDPEAGWSNSDHCQPIETFVSKWLDLGVKMIGGCCRTYAKDIKKIRDEVKKWNNQKFN